MNKIVFGLCKFIIHVVVATVGVGVITFVSVFSLVSGVRYFVPNISPKLPNMLCTQVPGFPMQVAFGFAIGFVLWRCMMQRVAFWAWIPAVALLVLATFRFALGCTGESSFSRIAILSLRHFFGEKCTIQQRCFDQVMYTLPSVAAASYSLGAFVASRKWGPCSSAIGRVAQSWRRSNSGDV